MKKIGNKKIKSSGYEGLQKNIRSLKTPVIDVWENKYADKDYEIRMQVPEFTCICPKTGLPDFAILELQYRPNKYCIELKSFKYYINFYRNIGVFHEHVVNKILEDFVKAAKPKQAMIIGHFNARGGIKTTVSAEYKEK